MRLPRAGRDSFFSAIGRFRQIFPRVFIPMSSFSELLIDRTRWSSVFYAIAAYLLAAFLFSSVWFFGSWEMWWFWGVLILLCASCAFAGVGAALDICMGSPSRWYPARAIVALLSLVPFLGYGLIRATGESSPGMPIVAMEAERSLLLFATPVFVALLTLVCTNHRMRRIMLWLLLADMVMVGICGVVNHYLTNDMQILWVAANDFHYEGRASAPFYCPNHFSAYLNIGICYLAAICCTPGVKLKTFFLSLVIALLLTAANFYSLSRGGLASLFAGLAVGVPLFALRGHRPLFRFGGTFWGLLIAIGIGCAVRYTNNPLMQRMEKHPLWRAWMTSESHSEFADRFSDCFWYQFDRGTYIDSALRAWRCNPVWGIGPGQHSNRWGQFAATEDGVRPVNGDPKTLKKPRLTNTYYHLYEVHSDWTQLLEEYGVVGFLLFLIAYFTIAAVVFIRQGAVLSYSSSPIMERALPTAALLLLCVYTIHSLFDFSLQIPAIVWTIGFLLSAAVLACSDSAAQAGRGEIS